MRALKIRPKSILPAVLDGPLLVTVTILWLSAWTPAVAQPPPELFLDGDLTDAGELRIGGHLDIALADGEPLRSYTVLLVDEADDTVASVDVMTNVNGKTAGDRLWTRTGVVGCDRGAVHDPASYQFESFAEAESVLDGRIFRVLVVEDPDASPGEEIVAADLPMAVVTPFAKAYPSDGAGCLRTELRWGRPLYLAISHQAGVAQDFRIFVVDRQAVWSPGDPLIDVRGDSQMITVPAGADPWVELLWASTVQGEYQIILRRGDSARPAFDQATDFVVETGFAIVGSTYTECGGLCPP